MFQLIEHFEHFPAQVRTFELSPDENKLAVSFNSLNLALYDMEKFQQILTHKTEYEVNQMIFFGRSQQFMLFVHLIPSLIVIGHLRCSSITSIRTIEYKKYPYILRLFNFQQNFDFVVVTYGKIKFGKLHLRKQKTSQIKFKDPIDNILLSQDNQFIIVGIQTGIIQIISNATKNFFVKWRAHLERCNITISENNYLLSYGNDSQLKLWDLSLMLNDPKAKQIRTFQYGRLCQLVEFSKDFHKIYSIYVGQIVVWDIKSSAMMFKQDMSYEMQRINIKIDIIVNLELLKIKFNSLQLVYIKNLYRYIN